MEPDVLWVTMAEFHQMKEWEAKGVPQFLAFLYTRWPALRELPFGSEVKVKVEK